MKIGISEKMLRHGNAYSIRTLQDVQKAYGRHPLVCESCDKTVFSLFFLDESLHSEQKVCRDCYDKAEFTQEASI